MGVAGEPDRELVDLLAFIDDIQHLARKPIRAGAIGRTIYEVADERIKASPLASHVSFVAHGMGIIGHEAPRLSARGPVAYPAYDADLPLQENMVISIETTLMHPVRGFIKLEDTVAVTAGGCEGYGDEGRGWNAIPV
jgi:Xaa-Pro aminopeptidase